MRELEVVWLSLQVRVTSAVVLSLLQGSTDSSSGVFTLKSSDKYYGIRKLIASDLRLLEVQDRFFEDRSATLGTSGRSVVVGSVTLVLVVV